MNTDNEMRNAVEVEPGVIDCEILHPTKGWLPHTCCAADIDPAGKARHEMMVATNSFRQMTTDEAAARAAMKRSILEQDARQQRDGLIAATDWRIMPDISPPLSTDKKDSLAAYRQALRDVPLQAGFPETIVWPTPPT